MSKVTDTFPIHPVLIIWGIIRMAAVIGAFAWGGPLAGICAIIASIGLHEK